MKFWEYWEIDKYLPATKQNKHEILTLWLRKKIEFNRESFPTQPMLSAKEIKYPHIC